MLIDARSVKHGHLKSDVASGFFNLDLLPHKDKREPRVPGHYKGKLEIPSDFFDSPEEIITAFEGDL